MVSMKSLKCRNCRKVIFAVITPGQVKKNLIDLGVRFDEESMYVTCPICKRPNKFDRRLIAEALKMYFKEQEQYLIKES